MQLKDLQWFEKTVEMRSLHSAATVLGVTQPALSKSIRRLETELGVLLLERTPRGVIPTEIGRALLQRVAALGEWELDTLSLMRDMKSGETGELRVGVVPALLDSAVIPILANALNNSNAPVQFHISVQLSDQLLAQLRAGELDFAVAAINPAQPLHTLGYRSLGKQNSHVVARKGHPLSRREFSLPDLAAQPWVLPPSNISLRAWLDKLFADAELSIRDSIIYTDATPAAFSQLLRKTDALTVMTADSLLTANGAGLITLPKPAPTWTLELAVYWRSNAYFSKRMEIFRSEVAQAFRHLRG